MDRRKGNCKGKDTEMEKGARLEGHCGHGEERQHRHECGGSRHQCRDGPDTNLNSGLARCTMGTRVKPDDTLKAIRLHRPDLRGQSRVAVHVGTENEAQSSNQVQSSGITSESEN